MDEWLSVVLRTELITRLRHFVFDSEILFRIKQVSSLVCFFNSLEKFGLLTLFLSFASLTGYSLDQTRIVLCSSVRTHTYCCPRHPQNRFWCVFPMLLSRILDENFVTRAELGRDTYECTVCRNGLLDVSVTRSRRIQRSFQLLSESLELESSTLEFEYSKIDIRHQVFGPRSEVPCLWTRPCGVRHASLLTNLTEHCHLSGTIKKKFEQEKPYSLEIVT